MTENEWKSCSSLQIIWRTNAKSCCASVTEMLPNVWEKHLSFGNMHYGQIFYVAMSILHAIFTDTINTSLCVLCAFSFNIRSVTVSQSLCFCRNCFNKKHKTYYSKWTPPLFFLESNRGNNQILRPNNSTFIG